VIIDN